MEALQELLNALIEKYNMDEADVNAIQEVLVNLEAPEYQGVEAANGEDFEDPYAEEA